MSEWSSWIGRTSTSEVVLDPRQANRMAVTLDRDAFFDNGDALPPGWHWLYFHDLVASSRLGRDGHPAPGEVLPPVPLERRMWAGGALTFSGSLRLGQAATRTSTITAITPKHGRSGPLYFVAVEHDVSSGEGRAIQEKQTIVYRAVESTPTEPSEAPSPEPDFQQTWSLDSAALFRYSALTFNAHRIHYDADYARDVEGYPGLVIHGPLLATLLMDLAERHGSKLATFDYRAQSPLFLPEAFTTNGKHGRERTALWAAAANGRPAMAATTTYRQESKQI